MMVAVEKLGVNAHVLAGHVLLPSRLAVMCRKDLVVLLMAIMLQLAVVVRLGKAIVQCLADVPEVPGLQRRLVCDGLQAARPPSSVWP